MASRNFHRVQSLTREVKSLFAKVAIGASGAPTLNTNLSVGVASITRDSAGVYEITLDDKYNNLLHVHVVQLEATAEDLTFQVESDTVSTDKKLKIQCKAAAVETDPSDGSALLIKIELKNTSVSR
jgi:6-phosphogluconolactonase (cycloisomerase 2 family)